jgi:hypothetical protein
LLTDVSTQGSGACAGVSAAQVIAAMQSAHPELADIPSTRDPDISGDGSFVFSYLRADGSFALVVKRGDGDCVAGCVSNEYGYFATDATCTPQEVGHYSRVFAGASNLNCYVIEGTALWGVPSAAEPADVCVEEEDGGLARVDRVCEQRFADFSMRLSKIKAANRSCTSDDDCVVVDNAPDCSYSCGDITNRAGAEQVAALVAAADSTVCNADGVTCASTGIVPPCAPIRAGCVGNVCQGQ